LRPKSSPSLKAPQKAVKQHAQTDCPVSLFFCFPNLFLIFLRSAMVRGTTLCFCCCWWVLNLDIPWKSIFSSPIPVTSNPVAIFPNFSNSLRYIFNVLTAKCLVVQPQMINLLLQTLGSRKLKVSPVFAWNVSQRRIAELYLLQVLWAREAATKSRHVFTNKGSQPYKIFFRNDFFSNVLTGPRFNELLYFCTCVLWCGLTVPFLALGGQLLAWSPWTALGSAVVVVNASVAPV
jgi:hypothetical protein